jgi:hypothetical protein
MVEKKRIAIYYEGMGNVSNPSDITGKKIFFLHPTVVVQNKIIDELIQQEYEVYVSRDHAALGRLLKKYPDSIVFADINEQLPAAEWEKWIRGVTSDPETKDVITGIVTARDDEELRQKFTGAAGIRGGYTVLKSDLNIAIKRLFDILNLVNAKGQRKYLRAAIENEVNTTINLPVSGAYINGQIKDISVVGISCAFANDPNLVKNTLFKDIQLKLQSILLNVEGIVFGSRIDGNSQIYVILFTQRIDPVVRTKIRKYIQQNLQNRIDSEMK